jgi:uncharacterized protein (TIGR02594 family)
MKDHSKLIYDHALRDNGLKELPGTASAPRIRAAILAAAKWLDPDDSKTAWCGCIRGLWGLETGTGVPPAHYRAASWAKWGKSVSWADVKQGDTVVMKRTGGNHVGLYVRHNATHVWIFGGNQSNACNVTRFARELVTDIRRA